MRNMSEEQAFITLLTVVVNATETQFRTNKSGASLQGGVSCWTGSVKYLQRTYVSSSDMVEVVEDLRDIEKH